MANLLLMSRYTEEQKKEIMAVFVTPNRQKIPRFIESVSEELLKQIQYEIQLAYVLYNVKGESGAEFRTRGADIKKHAKRLKMLLKGSSKGVSDSVDIMLAETMKMPRFSELNEYLHNKGAFVIEWFLEALTLIEITGHDIEHRAYVTKGRDYSFERHLIQSIAMAWTRVTERSPSNRRDTPFHKLVVKIFELEGLGGVSEGMIKSSLNMYK